MDMAKPIIRFKGYQDDWEQRKLGATNTFFTDGNYGEAYPKSSDMTDSGSGIPFLTGGNLKDGKLSLDGASYITPEKHSKLTSGHLLEDDIVIAVRGSLGALGYVNTDNSGWNINSQLAILRTDKSELYGKFLIQYLLSWTGQNELLKRQTGSALKQLPIGAIKDVEVPITSIAEQGKIGEYFADLDNLITLHQRKCDETKRLKKYMLQKMFPQNGEKVPEIRFSGFTDDWEQRKLGEHCEMYNGDRSSKYPNAQDMVAEGIPFINAGDLENGRVNLTECNKISREKYDDLGGAKLQLGDIVYCLRGTLGKNAYIDNFTEGTVASSLVAIRPKNIDGRFMFHVLNSDIEYRQRMVHDEGAAQPNLSAKSVSEFIMPVPHIGEQKKISAYFDNLDHLITLHQRELENLQNIKKFMLEKMFV